MIVRPKHQRLVLVVLAGVALVGAVLLAMWGLQDRAAYFVSALTLAWPDGHCESVEGRVYGKLAWPVRGGNGFGYDPMFVADGAHQTFGEMEPAQKYAISHRTRAFAAFKAAMLDHLKPVATDDAKPGGRDVAALSAAAASLSTRSEAAAFIAHLKADLEANKTAWANATLEMYLAALEQQLKEASASDEPAWRQLAKAMLAASERS